MNKTVKSTGCDTFKGTTGFSY